MSRRYVLMLCVFPMLMGQQCMEPLPQSSGTPIGQTVLPQVTLHTNQGEIVIELFMAPSANAAGMFKQYLEQGYYNNTVFHHAYESWILGGRYRTSLTEKTPRPTDSSGLDNGLSALRGRVVLYTPTQDTEAVPELVIVLQDDPDLSAAEYTVVGRVVSGMSVVQAISSTETVSRETGDGGALDRLPKRPISVNDPDLNLADYTDPANDSPEDENGAPTDEPIGPDATRPTVRITTPTSESTYTTQSETITIGGTASDNLGVTEVRWSNDRGGSGTCTGTTSWSQADIALESGENVITVTAVDAAGNSGSDTLTVTYNPRDPDAPVATVSGHRYVVPGVVVTLNGTQSTDPNGGTLTYQWRQTSGETVTVYDETGSKAQYIAPDTGSDTDLIFELVVSNEQGLEDRLNFTQTVLDKPKVVLETSDGDIVIELLREDYPVGAPLTVQNFAQYVEDYYYDNTIFHRVLEGFVIQTGGYIPSHEPIQKEGLRDPVPNEFDAQRSNVQGTVAMATASGDPNSGTSQFFINLVDKNTFLDAAFHTVFGRVIDGWSAIDRIAQTACEPSQIYIGEDSYPMSYVNIYTVKIQP
jgi:cyclophilin family peptidyl-prolyl cis-trans isomerase